MREIQFFIWLWLWARQFFCGQYDQSEEDLNADLFRAQSWNYAILICGVTHFKIRTPPSMSHWSIWHFTHKRNENVKARKKLNRHPITIKFPGSPTPQLPNVSTHHNPDLHKKVLAKITCIKHVWLTCTVSVTHSHVSTPI